MKTKRTRKPNRRPSLNEFAGIVWCALNAGTTDGDTWRIMEALDRGGYGMVYWRKYARARKSNTFSLALRDIKNNMTIEPPTVEHDKH